MLISGALGYRGKVIKGEGRESEIGGRKGREESGERREREKRRES